MERQCQQRVSRSLTWGTACLGVFALLLSGCSTDLNDDDAGETVAMATTTQLGSVLNDITTCVGTQSTVLMGPGDDPHVFAPSSAQIAQMSQVDLVVANGLGLESQMGSALNNASQDGARVLEVAAELEPLSFGDDNHGNHEHDHDHADSADHGDHHHGDLDPHVWMDVSRMATAAELMGAELTDATGDTNYDSCAASVAEDLRETHAEVSRIIDEIPRSSRRMVTDHAAYNYFADAYDVDVSAVVIPGGGTEAEPSSQLMAELVGLISDGGADVLVTSMQTQNRVIEALASESEVDLPLVKLYEGGLGDAGSEAETYAEAMIFNAHALADALSQTDTAGE